jgi:Domain of unknown function (DUF4129)
VLQAPIPADAIRDTIARIVQERGYQQSLSSTLISRIWSWFSERLETLFSRALRSRGTYLVVIGVLALLIAVALARAVIVARARRQADRHRELGATSADELAAARALAAQGAYAAAAHQLYAAAVTRLVETKRVRRHSSKTVGDYWRELRLRGDSLASPYHAFSRIYEIVAYGDGLCDADRYQQLERLAAPLLSAAEVSQLAALAAA